MAFMPWSWSPPRQPESAGTVVVWRTVALRDIRERFRSLARLAFQATVLVVVAFLSAVMAIRFAIHGGEVVVPSVIGIQAGVAQSLLSDRGLRMRIADRVYNSQLRDRVVRQSPASGTRVKLTQRVHVVLSLGTQRVSIPALEGKTPRAARIELMRSGLQMGEISSLPVTGAEFESILLQDPPAMATDAGSPRVNILVAVPSSEAWFVMPDYIGLTLADAQRRISAAGLRMDKLSLSAGGGAPRATVVGQTPPRGSRIAAGASVALQVAE